jgi:hypothetical protein
MMSHT